MKRVRSIAEKSPKCEEGTQLNLLIPASKHRALKQYAAAKGKTMSSLVSSWIDEHIVAGEGGNF